MSDIIRDHQRRAYMNMLVEPFYQRHRGDKSPIRLLPPAEVDAPYTGEEPKVEGVPPVPGQGQVRLKKGTLA